MVGCVRCEIETFVPPPGLALRSRLTKATAFAAAPIHHASRRGSIKAVDLLLAAGADIELRDGYGLQTPFMKAGKYRFRPVMDFLLARGAEEGAYDDTFFTGHDLYRIHELRNKAPAKGGACVNEWLFAQKRARSIVDENGGYAGRAGYVSEDEDGELKLPTTANVSDMVFAQPKFDAGFSLRAKLVH